MLSVLVTYLQFKSRNREMNDVYVVDTISPKLKHEGNNVFAKTRPKLTNLLSRKTIKHASIQKYTFLPFALHMYCSMLLYVRRNV